MSELDDLAETLRFMTELRDRFCALRDLFQQMEADESPAAGLNTITDEEFHGYLGLRMGIAAMHAIIRWCEESIELVKQRMSIGASP